jgi:hypothetical protein
MTTLQYLAPSGLIHVEVPAVVNSCTSTSWAMSCAATETYTTAEPERFSKEPVEDEVRLR